MCHIITYRNPLWRRQTPSEKRKSDKVKLLAAVAVTPGGNQ